MRRQSTESGGIGSDVSSGLNFAYLVAQAHSLCITPFIRDGFGLEGFGLTVFFSCVIMLLFGAYAPAPVMFDYFLVWLLALVIQRARSVGADRRGDMVHSRYQGWPALAMRVPFVRNEGTAKLIAEPLICLAAGWLLGFISVPLGHFLTAGCFTLGFTAAIQRRFWRARVRRMRDAQIEQQQLMQMFNGSERDF